MKSIPPKLRPSHYQDQSVLRLRQDRAFEDWNMQTLGTHEINLKDAPEAK